MHKLSALVAAASSALFILGVEPVSGQDYPNKPIRIATGGAGGGSDFISRQIAQGISAPLGQPVIVENRMAVIARETVLKAPPDGYSLLIQGGSVWLAPLIERAPYDAVRDFAPIVLLSMEPNVLVVHPALPVKSVKELIALARARPGDLNYGSTSIGSATHMASELFKSLANINIVNIPFKSQAPAINALVSGEVQLMINDAGLLAPQVKSGRLKPLAVTSAQPSALAPGLPTVAASGLPGYEFVGLTGMWAPAKTPGTIIGRLNQEIVRLLNRPEVKDRFLSAGEEIVASSAEQFAATIKTDIAKMGKLIKDAGLKFE